MKKNKIMRIASVLLVATLLSTCAISGTFAKYVTQDDAADSARIAKWGVNLQIIGDLYGEEYSTAAGTVMQRSGDAKTGSVQVASTGDLVAPGTKNDAGMSLSLTGTPEVAGKIEATMKIQNIFLKAGTYGLMVKVADGIVTEGNFNTLKAQLFVKDGTAYKAADEWATSTIYYTLEDALVLAADYFPVVYKLAGDTAYDAGTVGADSLAAVAGKLAAQLKLKAAEAASDTSVTYSTDSAAPLTFKANDDLAALELHDEVISWAWAFDGVNNGADTILALLHDAGASEVVKLSGDAYVAPVVYADYCLNTMFSLDITVSQVD